MQACILGFGKADPNHDIHTLLAQIVNLQICGEPQSFDQFHTMAQQGLGVVIVNLDVIELDKVRRMISVAPDCKVIGVGDASDARTIIAATRAGCSQFVPQPVTIQDLRDAIESVRAAKGLRQSRRICVMGSAGGSGATTVACNLAAGLGKIAGGAAILDLDLEFGSVACVFDVDPKYCLADLCSERVDKFAVDDAVAKTGAVSVLGRPSDIRRIYEVTGERLEEVLSAMAETYPYTIVDMSRPNGLLGATALSGADHVLIVAQSDVPSVRNAARAREVALNAGVEKRRIKLVLNRCGFNGTKATMQQVEEAFGASAFACIPNDWKSVRQSFDLGQPMPKTSPAAIAIREMARNLAGVTAVSTEKKKRGWLRRPIAATLL